MDRLTRLYLCAAAIALPLSLPSHAQDSVYRCTDAQGRVAYQAQPCPGAQSARRVELDTRFIGRPQPARTEGGPVAENAAPAAKAPASAASAPAAREPVAVPPAAAPQSTSAWAQDADVIIVSGYEAAGRPTQVQVNHPARPVLLVLTSYHPTQWRVLPASGTRIKAVVLSSSEQRSTVQAPPGVPTAQDQLPYAIETANINFRVLLSQLRARYGVETVTAHRGAYNLPALVQVAGPFPADPNLTQEGVRPEMPRLAMNFDLVTTDGRRVAWTNSGPPDDKRYEGVMRGSGGTQSLVVREDGREAYALSGNGGELLWYPKGMSGPASHVTVPPDLPRLSWGNGLAWDTRGGVLAIVSFGGEGHFYRYDTRQRRWLGARSLQDRDLMGLSFNPLSGGYVSISDKAELVFFNGQGELEDVRPLAKILPDLDSTYDKHNSRLEGLSVVAQGKAVAIIRIAKASVTHIWTYEIDSRRAQLSYKMPQP